MPCSLAISLMSITISTTPMEPIKAEALERTNQEIAKLSEAKAEHKELLGHLLLTAVAVAKKEGIADDGFRLVVNNGERANQTVFHLHMHLLGGRDFSWPPG